MTRLTEQEWLGVQATLVKGGLYEYINELLVSRSNPQDCIEISDQNRRIIYDAYDDGDGNSVVLTHTLDDGYFVGMYDGEEVLQGIEIDGVLYTLYRGGGPNGPIGLLIGCELTDNAVGEWFSTIPEAKAYIRGLTEK